MVRVHGGSLPKSFSLTKKLWGKSTRALVMISLSNLKGRTRAIDGS